MNKRLTLFLAAAILALLLFARAPVAQYASGEPNNFVIDNADGVNTLSLSGSPTLEGLIQAVGARFTVEFANAFRIIPLAEPPVDLVSALQAVEARFAMEFANGARFISLTTIPPALQDLLAVVADRFVLEFANASHIFGLDYPLELIADVDAPVFLELSVTPGPQVTIEATTDEYTTATFQYGTAPGNYTQTLTSPLYAHTHLFRPEGLQTGQTYYFIVTVVDRSGNSMQSSEAIFTGLLPVFLPSMQK